MTIAVDLGRKATKQTNKKHQLMPEIIVAVYTTHAIQCKMAAICQKAAICVITTILLLKYRCDLSLLTCIHIFTISIAVTPRSFSSHYTCTASDICEIAVFCITAAICITLSAKIMLSAPHLIFAHPLLSAQPQRSA